MLLEISSEILIYYLAGTLFILLLITTVIIYIFLHEKKVNLYHRRLQQGEINKKQSVFAALQEGEENERKRLAEELHDGIGAKLSGLKMYLEYLKLKNNTDDDKNIIQKVFGGMDEIINELREISHGLQPALFIEKALAQLVFDYIEQLNSKGYCNYELFCDTPNLKIDLPLKSHCYRILTELLHNIHKHSKATSALIQIIVVEDKLQLIVEDNGIGFNKNQPEAKGTGLLNIHNRVDINKGTLNIDSSSSGTTIIIELPLHTDA